MLRSRHLMLALAGASLSSGLVGGCANDYTCEDSLSCPYEAGSDGPAEGSAVDAKVDGKKPRDGGADAKIDGRVTDGGKTDGKASDAAKDVTGDSFVCDPAKAPSEEACVISEAYGVFVAPSGQDVAGAGTRVAPFKTIGFALGNLLSSSKRVYVCSATYAEQVAVSASADGVQVYGGLACPSDAGASAWKYTGALAVVAPTIPGVALTLSGLTTGAHVEDVEVDATDGVNPGDSSVALFASGAGPSSFTRVTMKSGAGVMGATGMPGNNYSGAQAAMGNSPGAGTSEGAASLTCTCGDSSTSTGGRGGDGDPSEPTMGGSGEPTSGGTSPVDGMGGTWALGSCANGHLGNGAVSVTGGAGAKSAGALTATGWNVGAPGATGATAPPGQGGGGGSGGTYLTSPSGGGGSGGCGGCGGGGGTGGGTGGSSFALLSIGSSLTLDACTLTAGSGGDGGTGGPGQAGEPGGDHGNGVGNGCPGGGGGTGGSGGGGGGGAGGLSVAVGYVGTQPQTSNGTTTTSATTPAQGGIGGTGGSPAATNGATGVVQAVMSLTGDAG